MKALVLDITESKLCQQRSIKPVLNKKQYFHIGVEHLNLNKILNYSFAVFLLPKVLPNFEPSFLIYT